MSPSLGPYELVARLGAGGMAEVWKARAFGASGFGEFLYQVEAGDVRVLAVTSAERVDALKDVPTLKESGIDLEFTNWRGVLAPPGLSDAARDEMVAALTELHGTDEWREALSKNGWTDAFETGEPFAQFLREQDQRVESTLTELGLV